MSIVAKSSANGGTESYLHKYAKQVLVEWLREAAAHNDKNGYASLWGYRWNVARSAPAWGVYEEWSVLAADNGIKEPTAPWDEIDWANKIPGFHARECGENGYEDHVTYPYPPRADFLRIWKINPAAILDVAVLDFDRITCAFEIVHKSPVSDEKRQLLKSLDIQLVEVNALWVMTQIGRPKRLVTGQEMQLYVPRTVGKDGGVYGMAGAGDYEYMFTAWVRNRKSTAQLIFDPYAPVWGDHEVDEGEGATLFECLARTKYSRLGGDFDFLERVMNQCLTRGFSYGGNKAAGNDWGIYYCSAFDFSEPTQQGIMGDVPNCLTADEFVKNNDAVEALLGGWELHFGMSDGGGCGAFDPVDILRAVAEHFEDEEFNTLLEEDETSPRYINGYASQTDWMRYLNIAQRLKTQSVYRSWMCRTEHTQEDSWLDDYVQEALVDHG